MAGDGFFRLCCLLYVLCLSINKALCVGDSGDGDRKVYIVYMGSLPAETPAVSIPTSHQALLQETFEEESSASASASASASLIRSYSRSFNGFAAKLTEQEAQKLASKEGVFSVFPSRTYHVQTTRSWDYIGLPRTAKREYTAESNTIIGVLDTGVYPNSESFHDRGFGPPPQKWKGSCKGGANFTCNNKLIGARHYVSGWETALDSAGHGTHTASTAAGNAVEGASFFGIAIGTARGGVPSARVAVYSVCDPFGNCEEHAIAAALDDAIADGVDIITASLGWSRAFPFDQDVLAIGSFHAMSKGILVTHSAGNNGPTAASVSSVAPWILTVAANTIDRQFITKLVLGDGMVLTAHAINGFPSQNNTSLVFVGQCKCGSLQGQEVAGKNVICLGLAGNLEAENRTASGVILDSDGETRSYPFPAVALNESIPTKLLVYYNSTKDPRGRILKGETVLDPHSPLVADFSSRGPNQITPDIMKPDVSAPGVNILAAFPPFVPPTHGDSRRVKFNFISGTSMSCPHVAGAAAYVKTFHPDWSPSAIKSALMTTASKLRDGDEFAYGSGQINPSKALDPGLVYEITKADYVNLLCSLGFPVGAIDRNSTCPKGAKNMTQSELNYPSLIFKAPARNAFNLALNRTVTNVGPPNSTYKAEVAGSSNINVAVIPEVLSFKSISEKKPFTVKISGSKLKPGKRFSEELVWSDGVHSVRSPIIVYTN